MFWKIKGQQDQKGGFRGKVLPRILPHKGKGVVMCCFMILRFSSMTGLSW